MIEKIFTLTIVLYPILSAYILYDSIDLGSALCFIMGCIMWIFSKVKLRCPQGYILFLLYVAFAALFVTYAFPARILLYTFILVSACSFCKLDCLYNYYKKIAFVSIVFFFIQEAGRLSGFVIPGIFTFLPTLHGESSSFIAHAILNNERSFSFFLEPSYFAQFLYPLLVVELYSNNEKNHMRKAVLWTLVIFMIRSGNGIMLLGIIWMIWFIFSNIKQSQKYKILFAGLLIILFLFAYQPDLFFDLLDRTEELSTHGVDERHQSSGFIRFYRGYYLYGSLPTLNQFFGINPHELELYKRLNSLGLFDITDSFINGAQTILCLYGLAGFLFFFIHLYLFGKNSGITCKVLLVGVIYLLFSESYFICGRMLLTMVLIYLLKYNNENSFYYQHVFNRK